MTQDYREKYKRAFLQSDTNSGLEIIRDPKMENSCTYTIHLQDHTIGDLLRIYLLKKKEVKFAGYKMPHPLVDKVQIKVQTSNSDTGSVVKSTLSQIQGQLCNLKNQFDKQVERLNNN